MNETQRKINEYKSRIPGLKERVIAVALLLAISASMLVTVTFAWVALSTSPEVSGVNTSIASNGNLEIALVSGEYAPLASKEGDSNLPNMERNITWGNLINLADPQYGLENLVLRPALLNTFGLVNNPLYGPVYDESGRVIGMNTNFGYSKWEVGMDRFTSVTDSAFAGNLYGVRAITSMDYNSNAENATAKMYNEKLDEIESQNSRVQNNFRAIANVKEHQDALASLMTGYMIENQLKTNPSHGSKFSDAYLYKADLQKCVSMYQAVITSFEEEAYVIASLLNLQAEVNGVTDASGGFVSIDYRTLLSLGGETSATTSLTQMGFTAANKGLIANIDTFLADYNTLLSDVVRLNALIDSFGTNTQLLWKNTIKKEGSDTVLLIDDIINNLANVKQCTIVADDGSFEGTIASVGLSAAMDLNGKYCMTTINNGILSNFHTFSGGGIETNNYITLQVTVNYIMTINGKIHSKIKTSATGNYFEAERAAVEKAIGDNFGKPPLIAKDTYGFAVDLWVRTNAANTYLTLQGNVLTESRVEPVTGKEADGNVVDIYTTTVAVQAEEGEGESETSGSNNLGISLTQSFDVYKIETKDGSGKVTETKWYFADTHAEVTADGLGLAEGEAIPTPIQKMETVEYVIGFEGDNRVWEGDQHTMLSVNSTTQGSGSCYVFYAETPVDQERSLELLKSMKVAFVDDKGNLLAKAYMDSDRHYAQSGKVIVPLVLDKDSKNIGTDVNGDPMYAITALEQNVATRITAIVYLDGSDLTNDDVLASADIEGKINIQFGSSAALYPIMSEALYNAELIASLAEMSPTVFDYDTLADGDKMETTVKVAITGTQPTIMTANFIRRINATQGSPEGSFPLYDTDGDGVWEGTYEFLYPGTYIIRSVTIDGSERDLQLATPGEFPSITVNGFTIASVTELDKKFVMTGESSYTDDLVITFASNDPDKMPKTVLGKFIRDDGATVNVNFAYDTTSASWKGVANFVSSGEYKMQFLVLDGQYVELAEAHQRDIELILGMRVRVETLSPTTMVYGDPSTPTSLQMQVEIMDNNGDIIPNLAHADLYYAMGGTTQLHAKLTWNSAEKVYEGEFPVESGTWNFNRVWVRMGENGNTLTGVNTDAPVFTVIPPTPPTYISNFGAKAQFLIEASAIGSATVRLKDASSAIVVAKFINMDTDEVVYRTPVLQSAGGNYYETNELVNGEEVVYQNFQFSVPEDGLWKLESASVFNVFDSESNAHFLPADGTVDTEDEFLTGIVYNTETIEGFTETTIAVLHQSNIDASIDYSGAATYVDPVSKTVAFGKDASGNVTAGFMTSHNVNAGGITVVLKDDSNLINRGYFNIGDVKLSYKYASGDSKYGGYTSTSYSGLGNTVVGIFEFTASSGKYVLSNNTAVNFRYAAQYAPETLTYSVTSSYDNKLSETGSYKDDALKSIGAHNIEVWSLAPAVEISAINPTGTMNVDKTGKGSGHTANGATASFTKTEANVYFKCATSEYCGTTYHNYTRPSVTIKLSGFGNASSAYMSFGSDVQVYDGNTKTNKYEWSGNGNCVRNIGYLNSKSASTDDKTPAGTISSSELVLVYNGVEYKFTVPTITINNPY